MARLKQCPECQTALLDCGACGERCLRCRPCARLGACLLEDTRGEGTWAERVDFCRSATAQLRAED